MAAAPFALRQLDCDRWELRAFSDDSVDPIVLELDASEGRQLGLALADVLSAMDSPDLVAEARTLEVGEREVVVEPTPDGVAVRVARPR